MSNLSDFLGRIFFLVQLSSIFTCGLPFHRKTVPFSLMSLSFSTNNVCKNAVFFLTVSFPNRAFVFPYNRITAATAGSGKPAFLLALFLKNEKQNSRKIYTAMFSH